MKKIINFQGRPDHVFGSDELDTMLIWPESITEMDSCFRCREMLDSGEVIEYRIYGYVMPQNGDEYEEIMESIRTGDSWALEMLW